VLSTPPRGLLENVSLAEATTLGTGGDARYWVDVEDEPELEAALGWAQERALPVQILGGGSNLVCADSGFDGLVVRLGLRGVSERVVGSRVELRAGAGEPWDPLVERAVASDLAGIECLSGIPGRVGATPIQNVGAYGQDVSQTLSRVRCFDRRERRFVEFDNADCELSYRDSRFKRRDEGRFVVTQVTFALTRNGAPRVDYGDLATRVGPQPTLHAVRQAVLTARREKAMLADPDDVDGRSCGSFFVNPVLTEEAFQRLRTTAAPAQVPHYPEPNGRIKVPAGWLIEASGLRKGQRLGGAGISSKHALCIVAHPGAKSEDVHALASLVKRTVQERLGVTLEAEPRFVGLSPP
jgi:UDP-N-acetylmuramate dehydrogenase